MRLIAFALCASATALAGAAKAQESIESIQLDYTATGACPSQADFESQVRARTARASFAPTGAATRVFEVRLHEGRPAAGRVVVRHGRAVVGARDVQADSCSDVADALALVVALAVDPAALTSAHPPAAPPPASPPPPEPAPAQPPPEAAVATSPPPPAAAPILTPGSFRAPRSARPEDVPEARHTAPRTLSVGTDLAVSAGTVPSTLLAVSPYVGWQSSSEATVVPSVRLGFSRGTTGVMALPGGSAAFTWTAGYADGCATLWPARPARLSACARVEGGVLDAAGSQVPAPRTQRAGWLGIGPAVRAEWSPVAPMFIETELGVIFHLLADRFWFLPDTTAYQVKVPGLYASVGVGVYFL